MDYLRKNQKNYLHFISNRATLARNLPHVRKHRISQENYYVYESNSTLSNSRAEQHSYVIAITISHSYK